MKEGDRMGVYIVDQADVLQKESAATHYRSTGAGLPAFMAVMYGGVQNVTRLSSKHAALGVIFYT